MASTRRLAGLRIPLTGRLPDWSKGLSDVNAARRDQGSKDAATDYGKRLDVTNALKSSLAHAMQRRATRPAPRRLTAKPTRAARISLAPIPADRAHDFSLFGSIATRFFRNPEPGGRRWARHQRMKSRSGYHVAPGLREAGGRRGARAGQRFFEVYYGAREVDGQHDLGNDRLNADWRAQEETGAALLYRQGDDGVVTVYLYPARTDKLAPVEDAIVLEKITETAALTGRGIMAKHWRALRAYAEVTSLDGEPSAADKALIGYLRLAKPQIRNGRVHPPEAWRAGLTVAALSFASALGAFVYATATAVA